MRLRESNAVSVFDFVGLLTVAAIVLASVLRLRLAIERFKQKVFFTPPTVFLFLLRHLAVVAGI